MGYPGRGPVSNEIRAMVSDSANFCADATVALRIGTRFPSER